VHADGAAPLAVRSARRTVCGDRELLLATEELALDALRDRLRADVAAINASDFASRWTGSPSRRSAFASSSLPVSIASTRRSRENH